MNKLFSFIATITLLILTRGQGFCLIIDSFDVGQAALHKGGQYGYSLTIDTPVGSDRVFVITKRQLEASDYISCSVDGSSGTVSFYSYNESAPPYEMSLLMEYHPITINGSRLEGPFDLSNYTAFTFDFSQMEGTGFLHIELNASDGFNPTSEFNYHLTEAGLVTVPFSWIEGGDYIDSFGNLYFTFVAESSTFSFTLDEIAVVPEPASYTSIFGGLALFGAVTARRRRKI